MYHLHQSMHDTLSMPTHARKWLVNRFIDQKQKENDAMEAERRKSKQRK
jgi:hypothetical protein